MFTEEAMAVFARHHGMATGVLLSNAGMGRRQRAAAVDAGLLEVWYERVFRIVSTPVTFEARCAALCLAYPRGFVTGPSGGRLASHRRMPATDDVVFCVPHGSNIGPLAGVTLRQSTKIIAEDTVRRSDGITVASPARLAFDLAADLSPLDLRSVIDQMLSTGQTSVRHLVRTAERLCHPARPGSARFLDVISHRSGPPVESHAELVVAEGLRRRGVPVVLQFDGLRDPDGRRMRLDMAVPAVRWGVEIDLHPYHLSLAGTARDKARDRAAHRIDWQIERVTELDLADLDATCDELRESYLLRCARFAVAG